MSDATNGTSALIDIDALTLDAVRDGALRGLEIAVLGFARSGTSLARFFADAGARVTIYDGRPPAELGDAVAGLGRRQIRYLLGPDIEPADAWRDAALVATSPSITPDYPTTEPRLRDALRGLVDARAAGEHAPALVSEADLVLRLCPAPTVGVTGTKGKTTTSSLVATILAADPVHPAVLGGNIGLPLVEDLPSLTPDHRVVIELSELQLPTISRGTTVAVYTNVTADHLDRHGTVEAYRSVKRRLAELVDPDGALVLNAEDPVVAAYAGLGTAPVVLYRVERPVLGGIGVVDGWIVAAGLQRLPLAGGGAAQTGPGGRIMPAAELAIPGRHNLSNALAAIATALLFGVAPDAIREAVAGFTGVEHRLESVALIDGVRFVNDSQGTQPDAVMAALRAFEPPLVLIAGGRDKGTDLVPLARVVAERASAAVLIGESGPALEQLFQEAGLSWTESAHTLEEAVRRADGIARELRNAGRHPESRGGTRDPGAPATVLLSPAAASFDMFTDYAERGRAFKHAVAAIARERRGSSTAHEASAADEASTGTTPSPRENDA